MAKSRKYRAMLRQQRELLRDAAQMAADDSSLIATEGQDTAESRKRALWSLESVEKPRASDFGAPPQRLFPT